MEKAEEKRRKAECMTIFVGGKQKRAMRPLMIEGMPVKEFIRANADPLWFHQHEMWEELVVDETLVENERADGSPDDREGEIDRESNSA